MDLDITGGVGGNVHTGISVDVWLYLPTKVQIDRSGRVYKFDYKYFHVGKLSADFQAKGWVGNNDDITCGTALGTKGEFLIAFTPDNAELKGAQPSRTIPGLSREQDVKMVHYIEASIGKGDTFIAGEIEPHVTHTDALAWQEGQMVTYERTYDLSKIPRLFNVKFDSAGSHATYSGLSHNCNHFTHDAIKQYIGKAWYEPGSPGLLLEGGHLIDRFDKAVKVGSKRYYEPAGYPAGIHP